MTLAVANLACTKELKLFVMIYDSIGSLFIS